MSNFVKKLLGDNQKATIRRIKKRVNEINKLESKYKKMSDSALAKQTEVLKDRLKKESLDKILPDAFAVIREAAFRQLGQRHFDVQLIGGIVLHEGNVAEMKTGEGKTLVATAPVYLNALTGKGAHVVTVNEYLVQRDAGWMGQVYHFLGLTTGVIIPDASYIYDPEFLNDNHFDERFKHLRPCTRQEAYNADITYGTNNEFGFDYLRDNMVREVDQLRQRELNYAIVDEVDSILIDEARTPLIISAPSTASGQAYTQFAKIAAQLKPEHYTLDEKHKQVALTDEGVDQVEKLLGIKNLYADDNIRTIYHLDQALRAQTLFIRDKDYVVTSDGEVVIVDEFTGRLLAGRRYNEGLHQAIEAKESVPVQEESMTLATISFQNYFRLYEKLAGMTGTALTESEEFHQIYKLDVIEIPTNKPIKRQDLPDRIYKTKEAKVQAIVKHIKELNEKGQPVLIGTVSIENNEEIGSALNKAGIKHEVLNAKNNEKEASIIAKAGQKGAVTLATNIAGRGTDIVLTEETKKLGGLFVLGSERHESRRIDNQLRGRSGRQGDPGITQFYVSTEDDLMRIFGGDRIRGLMDRLKVDADMPLENRVVSKSLEGAQKKVEGFNFDARKNVVKYDDVMNRHRKVTYETRRALLENANIEERIKKFIEEEAKVLSSLPGNDENYEQLITEVFPFDEPTLDRLFDAPADKFEKVLAQEAMELYQAREMAFTPEIMRMIERDVYFQILDNSWMQHLESMNHLREGIHWASVGQRDPLVEYRRRSQAMFEEMQHQLRREVLRNLYHAVPLAQEPNNLTMTETELTRAAKSSVDNADQITEAELLSEEDFVIKKPKKQAGASSKKKKQARKAERKNKKKGRR
ncbi:preprotein translocase subunit SecA [Candidatus Nomurabacteria bacterium]|jgi:preprotein translocase subunit SecA|nr:preprotein translocase subunit SecA [Candidatus Saccharibacteria bacterium]MCB9839563.1 preprotein translocase subunit SecA [Candidatus Nomurabacteria bacterium]